MAGSKSFRGTLVTPRPPNMAAPLQVQKQDTEQVIDTAQGTVEAQQEVAVRVQQSQELVQIMLNASIGSLFYLRGFLPLTCFDTRYLDTKSETSVTYQDFMCPPTKNKTPKKSQPLRILLRNRDSTADAILNLLEHGIFDALEKRVLEAVQLTISRDKDCPLHALESYTFTFAYKLDIQGKPKDLSSVSFTNNGDYTMEMGTLRSAKVGLEMIIRRLITLSTILPNLPSKRFLHIHLLYTNDCPQDYEPQGFKKTELGDISFPRIEHWTKETQSCGVMNGPFHMAGLRVTSLRWSGVGDDQIPENLEYSDTVSQEQDVGLFGVEEPTGGLKKQSQNTTLEEVFESTQARKDAENGRLLAKMLEPSSVDTSLDPTQKICYSASMRIGCINRPQLSQLKTTELDRQGYRHSLGILAHPAVSCPCGSAQQKDAMIECDFCGTLQHLICYGFDSHQDPRLPDRHACYECLLGPDERGLMHEMHTLALLRRALNVIKEEGYPNHLKVLAGKMYCSVQIAAMIVEALKKRGFLRSTPGSHKRGFAAKGLPSFTIPDIEDVRQRIDREIFDPFVKISHYYEIPEGPQQEFPMEKPSLGENGHDHPIFGSYLERSRRRLWPLDETLCRDTQKLPSDVLSTSTQSIKAQRAVESEVQHQWKKPKLSHVASPFDIGSQDYSSTDSLDN